MGKILVSPGGVKANKEKIDKLHKDFAYTAVKSGNSWMLPSGQNATTDEYIILNGELGKVTGSNPITGGSTAIVSGTNWTKLDNAGAMGVVKSLNDQIANINSKIRVENIGISVGNVSANVNNIRVQRSSNVITVGGYIILNKALAKNDIIFTFPIDGRPAQNAYVCFNNGSNNSFVAFVSPSTGNVSVDSVPTSSASGQYWTCGFALI